MDMNNATVSKGNTVTMLLEKNTPSDRITMEVLVEILLFHVKKYDWPLEISLNYWVQITSNPGQGFCRTVLLLSSPRPKHTW